MKLPENFRPRLAMTLIGVFLCGFSCVNLVGEDPLEALPRFPWKR